VRVTVVPVAKFADAEVQVVPQLSPVGLETMEPPAAMFLAIVSAAPKVAVTLRAVDIESEHVDVPVHAPDQPRNV
jgi:hypothetical protein